MTRVRSHGYVQIIFNVVTKDIETLGYRMESKYSNNLSEQKQRSANLIE